MDIPDKLRILSTISTDGNFSKVYLCENTYLNNRKEAVKLIHINEEEEDKRLFKINESLFESSVLEYLWQSDYIVKIYDAQILETGFRINMEYLDNWSLQGLLNKQWYLDNKMILRIAECILQWLEYAHSKNILHLDIKPWNILIKNENIYKLSDFWLAWFIGPTWQCNFRMIYNNHIPPENIGNWIATEQSDIYMFWITMYRLINWDSHFISQIDQLSHDDILLKIKKWEFPNRKYYLPHVHEKLRKIFNKCMNLDLSKRYSSAREIRGDLSKLKLIYNWKSITKEVDLLRYHWFMGDKLVYELVCERNNEWLWQLTFLKIWKKSIKVGRYSHKLLTINELNRKLEEIFFQFF